jgi:predicted alpha/beta-hydrolase family hydrolase
MTAKTVAIETPSGQVSGLFERPPDAQWLYVLAHGAGAGMRHAFMEGMATALADRAVATLRYQFPYAEQGRRRPDSPQVAQEAVRAAVARAAELAPGLPLVAGGKSYGGRMTSHAAAAEPRLLGVRGLVFLGFPLHAAGRPGVTRAAHLPGVGVPMLFVQGTRDALADLALIRSVVGPLGASATLHVVVGADHGFRVPKASGRTPDAVLGEIADAVVEWGRGVIPGS